MSGEMFFTTIVVLVTVVLFVWEKWRVDVVAALVMTILLLSGIITPEQGIAGFSNPATVSVAAMFVLSAGLQKTGCLDRVAGWILRFSGKSPIRSTFFLMLVVAILSAFMNNTATVVIFLPVTIELARRCGESPSKMLIPLSFASLFGGACTLVGTSTNILVSSIAEKNGLEPFKLLEMAPMGVILTIFGSLYLLLVGRSLLPSHPLPELPKDLTPSLCELVLEEGSSSCGKTLVDAPLTQDLDLDILEVYRGKKCFLNPGPLFQLQAGDSLKVRCSAVDLVPTTETYGVRFRKTRTTDQEIFLEAVVGPLSPLVGQTLKSYRFREKLRANVVALRRSSKTVHSGLATTTLGVGDVLLLATTLESLSELSENPAFVLTREVEVARPRANRRPAALAILIGVLGLISTGMLSLVVGVLLGCVLMLITGCLTADEAYEAIDWKVIVLLGGMLTLGTAVGESGLDLFIADNLLSRVTSFGPWVTLSVIYLLTSLLTEALSNSATAVLLAPIAIVTANKMGVDPKPFLMAITLAASSSFMSPVGYQTNTLVQGPGRYRFVDYLKVGAPLNLLFWVLGTALIPQFWPF